MSDPWELTAVDALAAMRAKELSPVELLASVQARADAVEPVVNALCDRFDHDALAAAQASEERFARHDLAVSRFVDSVRRSPSRVKNRLDNHIKRTSLA